MGFTRQFSPSDYPEGELPGKFPEPRMPDDKLNLLASLGIHSIGMVETIIADLSKMIKYDQSYSLDGYVLCLSRIISKETAWKCISKAYQQENQPIPSSYKKLFDVREETPPPSAMSVSK